jgi:hypothetical protein
MMRTVFKTTACAGFAIAIAAAYAQDQRDDQGGTPGTGQGGGITVTVDGRPLRFQGTPAEMVNDRVLVPLRGIFERLGAYVQWNPANREVIATRGHDSVQLQIGNAQATMDGRPVTLDVPAQIINGATMVPIRFVSESRGADVKWKEAEQLVQIFSGHGRAEMIVPAPVSAPSPWHQPGRAGEVLVRNSIIPVALDTPLTSDGSRRGERFTATVRFNGSETYGFLPAGARVDGVVVTATPRQGDQPGVLELQFTRIDLPDGSSYPISGRLIGLNDQDISHGQGGVLIARGAALEDNRRVFAGTGPEGRTVVVWGPRVERSNPRNVNLEAGTEFGVRLLRDVAIRGRDLRR